MEAFDPIVVKIKGDTADLIAALAAAKKAEDEFRASSKRTGDQVGADFRRTGKEADDFGRLVQGSMRDGRSALESLRLKSTDLRAEIGRLRAEFARTGNKSTFGDLQTAEADFKKITGYIKSMEGDAKALTPNVRQFSRAGSDSLSIFEELGGTLTGFGPAIALGVAALAPLLGGLAGGTVLSVLAGGGLAAGIITQFQSSEVQRALSGFEDRVSSAWHKATEGFGAQTASALTVFGQYLEPIAENLGEAFSHVAPWLTQIANAVGGSLQDFSINLGSDFEKMGPIFGALQQSLPIVIQGIGDFFSEIADHAPEIADDIVTIAHGFQTLADWGGKAIGGLSAEMSGLHLLYQAMTGDFAGFDAHILDALGGTTPITTFGDINRIEKTLGDTTNTLAGDYAHLAAEMKNTFDQAMALDGSEVAMYQSMNDLRDALKQNKGAWDITTRAGEAHRLALLQAIQATEEYYVNLGKVNGVTPQLAAGYKTQIDALLALAKQAGLSKGDIALLKAQFDSLYTVMSKADGKTITIPVDVDIKYHYSSRPSTGPLSVGRPFANSGVYDPSAAPHYDRSGVYPGRAGGYYMGEASTGKEALIGQYTDPGRAYGAIVTAASWHGLAVAPSRGGTTTGADYGSFGGGGGGGGMVMADVHLDADKVGYALLRWNGRMSQRSNVTLAGHPPDVTIGQLR